MPSVKKDFNKTLQDDCCKLLVKQPFIGHVLLSLELKVDNSIETAATDGFNIMINESFYMGLKSGERLFVLAHETWHVILLHFTRQGNRDRRVFNVAADLEIHFALKRDCFEEPFVLPHDPSWEKLSAEEIYERLLEKMPIEAWNDLEQSNGSESAGASGGDGKGASGGGFAPWRAAAGKKSICDRVAPGDFRGFDRHDWGRSEAYDREVADKLRTVLARTTAHIGGAHLPDFVTRLIDKFIVPRVDWRVLLKQYVTQCFGGERRWLPPARRYLTQRLYLPSRRGEKLDRVVVALDTSGSMQWNLPLIFGELVSLLKGFDHYNIDVIQCDTEVTKVDHFDSAHPFSTEKLTAVTVTGGNRFMPVFDYIREHRMRPMILIYLTDGYLCTDDQDPPPRQAPPYPVLWMLVEGGNADVAPWGRKIFVDETGVIKPPRRMWRCLRPADAAAHPAPPFAGTGSHGEKK